MAASSDGSQQRINLKSWYADPRFYQHRGHAVFFKKIGDAADSKPVLLFIHGFPTTSWDWEYQWHALSQSYHCLTADMMGFGYTAKPANYNYSIHDQADMFEGLLAAQSIDSVNIIAHDYGDTVAQELMARYLDRKQSGETGVDIQSVCLLNGGLFPETHHARFVQKLLNSPIGFLISRMMNRASFGSGFSAVFGEHSKPDAALLDDLWSLYERDNGTRIGHLLIRYIRDRKQHRERWVGALQKFDGPLRLINGPDDPVSGRHMTERYRELVAVPDIVLLDGIGHYPQLEAPEQVLQAILEWLN